jgi:cyclopropane fatty-acyl-phospholipid synthase-like methyltransferase
VDQILPPIELRAGGKHFEDDKDFVRTAVRDVNRLQRTSGLTLNSRVLDWGCGAGRLAIGIREYFPEGRIKHYQGVDVQENKITWAKNNLKAPGFDFAYINTSNARYNPSGEKMRTLALGANSVDIVYAYSVFSHMTEEDTAEYLKLIKNVLIDAGKAFITCFVEDNVPDWAENPGGYGPLQWEGRLHCALFNQHHFERLLQAAGLAVDLFQYGCETDGQSLYVLRKLS